MIVVNYYKKGIKINNVWFSKEKLKLKGTFTFYHGMNEMFDKKENIYIPQNSFITNLTIHQDCLFQNISKGYRYEIRRATDEKVEILFYEKKDIENNYEILRKFIIQYKEFTKKKRIKNSFNKKAVLKYIKFNNLILSVSTDGTNIFSQHMYICGSNQVRLLYSISNFRSHQDASFVGRANKFHHWNDIVFFKNKGIKDYDWGGITSFENPNGIDKFKMAFGGKEVKYYNIIEPINFIGKILTPIIKKVLK